MALIFTVPLQQMPIFPSSVPKECLFADYKVWQNLRQMSTCFIDTEPFSFFYFVLKKN